MARASFMLLLILSNPVGIHHQYADPGIHRSWKLFHALLTFAVFSPSLLTFFNVVASPENGARARGGRASVQNVEINMPLKGELLAKGRGLGDHLPLSHGGHEPPEHGALLVVERKTAGHMPSWVIILSSCSVN
jgi:heme/copper-type cytochrome/quinol oxidase subunit 1